MPKSLSHTNALEIISNWSIGEVLSLLRRNGLDDCCKAIQKRQVDGDELLHLTEGKLALWKSDLTRPLTWSLWTFVEEVKKSPEKYVASKNALDSQSEATVSDSGSWGTDFEEDVDDDDLNDEPPISPLKNSNNNNNNVNNNGVKATTVEIRLRNSEFCNNLMLFCENEKSSLSQVRANDRLHRTRSTITNGSSTDLDLPEDERAYANSSTTVTRTVAPKNVSNLHSQSGKSLAEQLKEQLRLRNAQKPSIKGKPEVLRGHPRGPDPKKPQKSFLHDVAPIVQQPSIPEKCSMASGKSETTKSMERLQKDLPRPPVMIQNFDLVANLPTTMTTDENDDDEYETFDEQIIEQNQRLSLERAGSKQSLSSLRHGSFESVFKSSSDSSQERQDEEYEIYESITETPEDRGYYLQPIEKEKTIVQAPPPLPAKPANSSTLPSPTSGRPDYKQKAERSSDKKSVSLPHSGSGTSLTTELRATRPLPPPPDKSFYMDSPWFHNVTREQATAIIKDRAKNGYFLLRPSVSHRSNPLALVLWFRDRTYNIPVRKRPDNRYALGTAKVNEQSFASVEDIVKFYSREELVLHTGGVQTGSTKLTDTPPK